MVVIQLLLIASALGLCAVFLIHRQQARTKAWAKLIFAAFVVFGIYALLRPDDLSRVAGLVGVGRGADLLLYCLVVLFAFTTLATYLRFLEIDARYARLARSIALEQARRERERTTAEGGHD